jgi:hypothetical protein
MKSKIKISLPGFSIYTDVPIRQAKQLLKWDGHKMKVRKRKATKKRGSHVFGRQTMSKSKIRVPRSTVNEDIYRTLSEELERMGPTAPNFILWSGIGSPPKGIFKLAEKCGIPVHILDAGTTMREKILVTGGGQ